MAPPDPDPRIGSVLDGRYRILHRLAEGSMGVVYRGERLPVGKPVAVKFLHAAFSSDPEFRQRFERETALMSKLTHPHCVSVVDFGIAGNPYMVMDFVTGVTLREILDEGPMAWTDALALMRQLLAGLAHAHSHGIVHRDVKPANVMVSEEIGTGRHVRILDFGLARLRGTTATSVTQTAVVVGTPNYMAPEQTVAGETDARTDVYAAGIILFEMVTGRRPFSAPDTMELFNMHRSAPVPKLRDSAPEYAEVPPGLDAIVRKALAKDPGDRYQSTVEFAEALDGVAMRADGERRASTAGARRAPSEEPPAASGWGGRLVAGLFIATAVAGGVVLAMRRDRAPATRPPVSAAPVPAGEAVPAVVPPPAPVAGAEGEVIAAAVDAAVDGDAASAALDPMYAGSDPAPGAPLDDAGVALAASDGGADDAGLDTLAPALAATGAAVADVTAGVLDAGVPDDPELAAEADIAPDQPEGETEAPDAPESAQAAEAREAAQPVAKIAPARSVAEAKAMLKRGQRGPALTGLRALWKKSPRSAGLPYLMGNIYYDMKWWSVALEHYQAAIQRAPAYKRNATLIRNVIHMMGTKKTRGKAAYFLRKVVGRAAKPYLAVAARRDPSPAIRSSASWLNKRIR
jgi:serine/threonine-protein kinase